MKSFTGTAIASLVASMFAAGCGVGAPPASVGTDQQAIVRCAGINSCAGTASCAGSLGDGGMHDCAGKNECAGQGWIEVSRSECEQKSGTVVQ